MNLYNLTNKELNELIAQNLSFIQGLSQKDIQELCGNNLEESIDRDLKDIESRLSMMSKFVEMK